MLGEGAGAGEALLCGAGGQVAAAVGVGGGERGDWASLGGREVVGERCGEGACDQNGKDEELDGHFGG